MTGLRRPDLRFRGSRFQCLGLKHLCAYEALVASLPAWDAQRARRHSMIEAGSRSAIDTGCKGYARARQQRVAGGRGL
jgi:hypothetical protein